MSVRPGGVIDTSYAQTVAVFRTRFQKFTLLLFLVVMVGLPFYAPATVLGVLNLIFIAIVSVHGLNLLQGYTGQVSAGQAAFMAVGAYSYAILAGRVGLPSWLALPIAALFTGLFGVVFGLPSRRLKGFYLAMSTLAAQLIVVWLIVHISEYSGGIYGLQVPRPNVAGFIVKSEQAFYFINFTFVAVTTYALANLARTRHGRAFVAVRDNEIAASAMGVNAFRYKLLAFFVSSTYAGIAGALMAAYVSVVHIDQFTLISSIWILTMVLVGGEGTIVGGIIGVVVFKVLDEFILSLGPALTSLLPAAGAGSSASIAVMVFGSILVFFLVREPLGLAHRWQLLKASLRLWPFRN